MPEIKPDRRAQMFPVLTPAEIERMAKLGTRRKVKAGEINMLSGRPALVRGRVAQDGELIEVDRDRLRELVQRDSEISEILMRAFILRRMGLVAAGTSELVLIGSRHSESTMTLRAFLTRNAQPFTYEDVESDPAVQALLDRFQVKVEEVPVVLCADGRVHRNPSVGSLAMALGLDTDHPAAIVRDVVVVGAGPAGLAVAVYAASEGLDVLVLEATAPGGQAGTSSRIENYLGFPTGISAEALAGRAFTQAEKFGATLAIGRRAARIVCDSKPYQIILEDGEVVRSRALIIASGVKYRKLALPDLVRFEGTGVFYSATHLEAQMCQKEPVVVVGGGNSAGQAAVLLSGIASNVSVLVRGPGLADSMSRYLIQRIDDSAVVDVMLRTQIEALEGDGQLESVRCRQLDTGLVTTLAVRHIFMMTGADPYTKWLEGSVGLDDKGFIKTGADLHQEDLMAWHWPLPRPPHALETTIPGVFAVGDARSGSTKRVASAVGEGAMCVQLLHRALAEL